MAGIQWASHLSPAVTGQSWVSLHAFGATKEKAGSPAAGMVVAAPASGATAKNGRGYGDGTPPSAQDDPPGGLGTSLLLWVPGGESPSSPSALFSYHARHSMSCPRRPRSPPGRAAGIPAPTPA